MASEALVRKLDRLGLSEEEYRGLSSPEMTERELEALLELEFVG